MSVSAGPFALSLNVFLIMLAFCIALLAGWISGRKRGISVEPALTSMLLIGLLGARLVFVLQYLDDYLAQPWTVFNLADGGFSAVAGIVAALITGAVYAWRRTAVRKPLGIALIAGAFTWTGMTGIIGLMHATQAELSSLVLTNLDGQEVPLSRFEGQPLVVNLWATWCPPCRREMPVLSHAQQTEKDIVFVFVNQGEHREAIRQYLNSEHLRLDNVLLDSSRDLMRQLGTNGLPSTFFFNAKGELADTHFGELSSATLKQNLKSIRVR